jgi:maltose alpha-D-glucosyltransferase/alpha-amylase
MIRSFHYATETMLRRFAAISGRSTEEIIRLDQWLRFWYVWVSVAFLQSYREHIQPANVIPSSADELQILLDAYLIDKAVHEIGYELNHRPDLVRVPLRGMLSLLDEH